MLDHARQWHHWLALSLSLSDQVLSRLLNHFPDAESILKTPTTQLAKISGLPSKILFIHPNWDSIYYQIEQMHAQSVQLVTWVDPQYPSLLRQIHRPPPVLFVKGNIDLLNSPQLAVVGSRKASSYGLRITHQLVQVLNTASITITSGLALGIDGAAHQSALKELGRTIAVLGSGINHIYPTIHHRLAQQIIEKDGLIVSEFPLNTPPKASHFPQRNRIISGLSAGTIIIEAGLRSGSLITARYALEENREVFAVPGPIDSHLSVGCHHLIQEGATLLLSPQHILEALAFCYPTLKNTH